MNLLLLVLACSTYGGQGNDIGLGIIIGEPTGICLKYFTSAEGAINAAAAWSLSGDKKAAHVYCDYLWHMSELASWNGGRAPLYVGVGGRAVFRDDAQIGARVPLGMTWVFNTAPFDVFLEIVPVLDLAPDTEFDLAGGVGVRFWF